MEKIEGIDLGVIVTDAKEEALERKEQVIERYIAGIVLSIEQNREYAKINLERANKGQEELDKIAAGDWPSIPDYIFESWHACSGEATSGHKLK